MKKYDSVDEYIKGFAMPTQKILEKIRATIKTAAPDAIEIISYQMPAYKLNGPLIYFAAHQYHIGLYPTPSAINAFAQELKNYKCSKGAVQFPIHQPIPLQLITKIVAFKIQDNTMRLLKIKS